MPIPGREHHETSGNMADRRLNASELKRMRRTPQVRIIRRALCLT
jgi:hypothetical protein